MEGSTWTSSRVITITIYDMPGAGERGPDSVDVHVW